MKNEKMKKVFHYIVTIFCSILVILGVLTVFSGGLLLGSFAAHRNHWTVETVPQTFTESAKELNNPNRGFYAMLGFVVREDVHKYFYHEQLGKNLYYDKNALTMVEINLCRYADGPISEEGLNRIRLLFQALGTKDKQYIIRFLYDWEGRAIESEPKELETILEHMSQLEPIFDEYQDMIFCLQGIFVGSHAEMHSSNHLSTESITLLIQKLAEVTPEDMFLSVRTPLYWRRLTGYTDQTDLRFSALSCRLGLFNDGMMGTDLDYGTYGISSKETVGPYGQWLVEEELAFQEELCKFVPNGGEVVVENPVNDFENAIKRMRTMHVTYLNQAYDKNVLDKWEASTVTEEGVFYGMDGLSYVKSMLGYRHLIDTVSFNYDFWQDELQTCITVRNVGFAPMYKEPEKSLMIQNKTTGEVITYPVEANLCSLAGGNDTEQTLTIEKTISLAGMEPGEYAVYFDMKDTASGWNIEFAVEQERTEYGYLVGEFSVGELTNPLTGETLKIKECLTTILEKAEAVYEGGLFGRR